MGNTTRDSVPGHVCLCVNESGGKGGIALVCVCPCAKHVMEEVLALLLRFD